MGKYGHFSEDGREYVVTRPDTPRPWINYLSNEKMCALCSHTGGGYSFFESSGYNRLTKEYPAFVVLRDRPGRYVYIRDRETGEFWSANWQPVCCDGMEWQSRQGQGYTSIQSSYKGIRSEITYFVPKRDNTEIWLVKVTNDSNRTRLLSAFSYVEWCLANYAFNLTEAAFAQLFNEVSYERGVLFVTTRFWNVAPAGGGNANLRWDKYAFFTSSERPTAFDSLAEEFIGLYRSCEKPIAVQRGHCSNSIGDGEDIVGALQHDMELPPGEDKTFLILLGAVYSKEEAYAVKGAYDNPDKANNALVEVKNYWDDYLSRTTCATPDRNFDLSFNIWNKYQAWITSRWSRMDSYYVGGASIIGFRDSWQDMLAILPNDVEWARQRCLYMLEHQFPDGSTLHNWDPLTNIGVKTGHSDDPLWLVLGVVSYIKESGDFGFLDEPSQYYDGGSETVRQHMIRALDYSLSRRSHRKIPLMEAADWNDGLDQVGRQGRGESTMVAEHLAWMLGEAAILLRRTGRQDLAAQYEEAREEIIVSTNEHLWDGEWYVRGTRDDGQVFGSAQNEVAKIFLNPQSWAVIGGVARDGRGEICMDSVWRHLDTDYGPALFLPAYREPNPKIGIITRFAPGTKENGTIFNHPVCWAIMAECILGRGEKAYELWRKSSFITRGEEPDVYKAEPYVYAEYVYGPDSFAFGRGSFTWTTGTAAWMWKVCLEYILGVRPEYDGLLVDPCIPSYWEHFSVKRRFRGALYEIEVENPERVCKGVVEVSVDGMEYESALIPPFRDGNVHKVKVRMGRS